MTDWTKFTPIEDEPSPGEVDWSQFRPVDEPVANNATQPAAKTGSAFKAGRGGAPVRPPEPVVRPSRANLLDLAAGQSLPATPTSAAAQLREDLGHLPVEDRLDTLRALASEQGELSGPARELLPLIERENSELARIKLTDPFAAKVIKGQAPAAPKAGPRARQPGAPAVVPEVELLSGSTPGRLSAEESAAAESKATALAGYTKATNQNLLLGQTAAEEVRANQDEQTRLLGDKRYGWMNDDVRDTGIAVAKVVPLTAQFATELLGMRETRGWLKRLNEDLDETKSPAERATAKEFGQIMADKDASPLAVVGFLMANPGFLTRMGVETSASVLPGVAVGRLAGLAARGHRGAAVTKEMAEFSRRVATRGAIGTETAMGAAATYHQLLDEGKSASEASLGALVTGAAYAGIGRLTNGGLEGMLARGGDDAGRIAAGFKEAGQEFLQGGADEVGAAIGAGRDIDPYAAAKQGAVGSVLGFGLGVAGGQSKLTPGQQLAAAMDADRAEREFTQSSMGEEVRARMRPGSYDPMQVDPVTQTQEVAARRAAQRAAAAAAPTVEAQPTTVITPEEIASVPVQPQDQAGAIPTVGAGTSQPTPAAPVTVPGQAPGETPVTTVTPAPLTNLLNSSSVLSTLGFGAPVGSPNAPTQTAAPGAAPNVRDMAAQPGRDRSGDGPGLAASNAERVAVANANFAAGREALAAKGDLTTKTPLADLRPADEATVRSIAPVIEAVSSVLGTDPVAVAETDSSYDGVNWVGRVILNMKGLQKPAAFVVAHESVHSLQDLARAARRAFDRGAMPTQEQDDALRIWEPMEAAIWDMVPTTERTSYAASALGVKLEDMPKWMGEPKNQEELRREFMADFGAKRLTNPEDVNALAAREPAMFGDFARKIIDGMSRVIEKLKGSRKGLGENDVDKHIKDIAAARLMWQDALIGWKKRGGAKAAPLAEASQDASFSARVQEAAASGSDLKLDETSPDKSKPVVLAFGGTFNPVHAGHVKAATDARDLLIKSGYTVEKIVVSPSPQSLMRKKSAADASLMVDRTAMLKEAFKDVEGVEIADDPSREADQSEGKANRTAQSDWVAKKYPDRTVVSIAGEDTAPDGGPGFPGLYTPQKGNLKGNAFLAVPRDEQEGISSSKIRKQIEAGQDPSADESPAGVTRYFKATKGLSSEVAVDGALYDGDAENFGLPKPRQTLPDGHPLLRDTATLDTATDKATGREMPRSELHAKILAHPFQGKSPANGKKVAYVMGGGGASGKGTLKNRLIAKGEIEESAVDIDPDEIKALIPEYQAILNEGDSRAADRVHNESSALADQVVGRAVEGGYSIILDKTLANPKKAAKALKELREKGYEVRLFGVYIAPESAIVRAALRAQKTSRHVPYEVLLKAHKRFTPGFEQIAAEADQADLYDSTDGFYKLATMRDGSMEILEPVVYNKAVRTAENVNENATTLNGITRGTGAAQVREAVGREGRPQDGEGAPLADVRPGGGLDDRGEGATQGDRRRDEGAGADPSASVDGPSNSARSVYVSRTVANPEALLRWAEGLGIKGLVPASELHVTLAYSRKANPDFRLSDAPASVSIRPGGGSLAQYAGGGSVQLKLDSPALLERHKAIAESGAPWQRGKGREFSLHITLARAGANQSVPEGRRFPGRIELGAEEQTKLRHADKFVDEPSMSGREESSTDTHKLIVERAQRSTIKEVKLGAGELALVKESAAAVAKATGMTAKQAQTVIAAELTRKKGAYPESDGWAPLEFKGAKAEKDDDGNILRDDDGAPVLALNYKASPYNFHVGAAGKVDTKTEPVRAEAMAIRLKAAAMDLLTRRDNGDKAAVVMLRQAGWYKNMRQRLRSEFGGFGDFVADLLGATSPNTPVRTNWDFTIEAMRMASNGSYDSLMPEIGAWWTKYTAARDAAEDYLQAQVKLGKKKVEIVGKKAKGEDAGWERQPDPVYADLLERSKQASKYEGTEPLRENGKRYGINTNNVLAALGDLWREVEVGTAPKARNFSGNLIGFRTGATIDVWAARLLRRFANEVIAKDSFPRIPPPAEKGVGGKHLTQDTVGGEFGFGQLVFNKAAKMLRDSGAPEFANIGDDDLQAIVWFLEKEHWTKNNWTNAAGEGGSFEQEADLSGSTERDTIKELRRVVDSSKSSPEMREAARSELAKYDGTLQRFTGGLSIQTSAELQGEAAVPTDEQMADVRRELEAAASAPETVAFRAFSTLGRYDSDERSFDVEGVTRIGYDLGPLHAKMREVAKRRNQDSFFTAKALQPNDKVDPLIHRPGVEIFFSKPVEMAEVEPILAALREKGVKFFTFITDGRRTASALTGAMPKVAGVRMLDLPEFAARYGDSNAAALAGASDAAVVSYMQQRKTALQDISDAASEVAGVSYARVGHYEVKAEFKEQYDGYRTGRSEGTVGPQGGDAWTGQLVREAVAFASAGNGAPGPSGLQDGAGDLRGDDGQLAEPGFSRRSDAAGGRRDGEVPGGQREALEGQAYGVATPGAAAPLEAYHFSKAQRSTLVGSAYGTGLRGAEAARLQGADSRLRQRVYFYFNQGTGIRPESGVGGHAHRVTLRNLYDISDGRIRGADANAFEAAVLDAGYDGYMTRLPGQQSGQAVLLGDHSVPVEYLGMGAPQQTQPVAASQAAAASSTRAGGDLVSKVAVDAAAVRAQADIKAVAPSFRFEFGKARVNAEEAAAANAALEEAGSEISFSRRLSVSPARVLEAIVKEASARLQGAIKAKTGAQLGRTPHVLNMLGVPSGRMEVAPSVVQKVFVEKHAAEMAGVPVEDVVRGLYRPAMIFKRPDAPNEYEIVTSVPTKTGPLTAAIVVDRGVAYVKSIYPRSWKVNYKEQPDSPGAPTMQDIVNGYTTNDAGRRAATLRSKIVYYDEYQGPIAVTGDKQFYEKKRAEAKSGKKSARPNAPVNNEHFRTFQDFELITRGNRRKAKTEDDLLAWIGDNYDGDMTDVPSYSARQPGLFNDSLGRFRMPTGLLANRIGERINSLLAGVKLNYASPEFKRQLRAMKLELQKSQEVAISAASQMTQLSEGDRRMISDIVEKELAAGIAPPQHALNIAAGISAIMEQQTNELIALDMLAPETADRLRGKYLPRFYESKLRPSKDKWMAAAKALMSRQPVMLGIKGKRLKGRGLWETVPAADVKQWEKLGWEVRDPSYVKGQSTDAQMWRDFTREERDNMGEIRDAGFRFVMGYTQAQKDIAIGKMFKGIAADRKMASKSERENWVRVPDGTIEGTGAKRYGALSGMWVSPEVFSHLESMDQGASEAMRVYRKAMSLWKEGKTVLNPVSHANNVLSNISMAHFAGVSYWDAHKYAGAVMDLAKGRPMVQEAKDAGLFLGTMNSEELTELLPPELRSLAKQQEGIISKSTDFVWSTLSWWLRRPMGKAYENEDLFFRYLIYRDARKRGLEPEESVEYAQRYIFTYDDLPKTAQRIRDFGLPFFAYTYKVFPALAHTMAHYPHRMLAPAGLLYGLNMAMYAIAAGDDDEDWAERVKAYLMDPERRKKADEMQAAERENLPPWMKGNVAIGAQKAIRLGTDEALGLPIFWDVGQIMPGGNLFDAANNMGGVALPQSLMPSHPLWSTALAMMANKDPFFGKPIVDENDSLSEVTQKRGEWIWRQLTPAIAYGNYHTERLANYIAKETGEPVSFLPWRDVTGVGKDGLQMDGDMLLLNTVGIKVRPVDLEQSAEMAADKRKAIIKGLDAEIRRWKTLNKDDKVSDANLDAAVEWNEVKKERLRDGLTVDGEKPK